MECITFSLKMFSSVKYDLVPILTFDFGHAIKEPLQINLLPLKSLHGFKICPQCLSCSELDQS